VLFTNTKTTFAFSSHNIFYSKHKHGNIMDICPQPE
jgi:hypothetical protein